MKLKTFGLYGLWIITFEAISFATAAVTNRNIETWYETLTPPPLVPPNWVFPVVWSILYVLIACTGCLLWQRDKKKLFSLFGVYMLLNWSWSFVYFGLHLLGSGLIEIIAMDILILVLIIKSRRQVKPAALLMFAPLLWSLFATYLNAGYWWLN